VTKITAPFYNIANAPKNKEAGLGNRTDNVRMLRRVLVTTVAVRKQQCLLSIFLGYMPTVCYINIFSVAQQYFYGEFISHIFRENYHPLLSYFIQIWIF